MLTLNKSNAKTYLKGKTVDKLDWTGSFKVGNFEIDHQRRNLLNILNQISILNLSDINVRGRCYSILEKFSEEMMRHFAYEARELRRAASPDYGNLIAKHNRFYFMLREIKAKLRANEISVSALYNQLIAAFSEYFRGAGQLIRQY